MSDDELKTLKESIEFVKNLDFFNKNNEKQNSRIKKVSQLQQDSGIIIDKQQSSAYVTSYRNTNNS